MSTTYSCEHCTYSSTRLYNLNRHKLTHSNQSVESGVANITTEDENVTIRDKKVTTRDENVTTKFSLPNQCHNCEKIFRKPFLLRNHIPKCRGKLLPTQCPKCRKILASPQSKCRHIKTCKVPEPVELSNHNITNITNNITNITNNITNNDNRTIINLVINSYGNENVAHITSDYLNKRLLDYRSKGVVKYVEDVHFNPEIPENHNYRKINNKELQIYKNGEWIKRPIRKSITELVEQYIDNLLAWTHKDEFEKYLKQKNYKDDTLLYIQHKFTNLNKRRNPQDFWDSVTEVIYKLEDLEEKYQELNENRQIT